VKDVIWDAENCELILLYCDISTGELLTNGSNELAAI